MELQPQHIFITAFVIIVLISAMTVSKRKAKAVSENSIYREAAESLNIGFINGGILSSSRVIGEIGGKRVFAGRTKLHNSRMNLTAYELCARYSLQTEGSLYVISRNGYIRLADLGVDLSVLRTKDDAFDSAMTVAYNMNPSHAIALLGHEIRAAIMELNQESWCFQMSKYGVHFYSKHAFEASADIVRGMKRVMALADRILENSDFRESHIRNIRHDSVDDVRLNNLRMLVTYYPVDREIEDLLVTLLDDSNAELQFIAAINLKHRGFDHLIAMIKNRRITGRDHLSDAIQALAGAAYHRASPLFIELFSERKERSLRLGILEACKKMKDPELSEFLASLLEQGDGDIVDGAVSALATCGTVRSVEKLTRLAEGSLNPFLRNRIGEAVAAIQSRLGDVEGGWLSGAEISDMQGALSRADNADEGSLSRVDAGEARKDMYTGRGED